MSVDIYALSIDGVFELRSLTYGDHRGTFLNAYREQNPSFVASWGNRSIKQVNLSKTEAVGTIRGLHLQSAPYSEAKLVRCIRGRVWDVAVDLREGSETYGQFSAVELTPKKGNALLIPEGCAHGFQVLEPGSQLLYLHSGSWVPEAETGVVWNDPKLDIPWPLPVTDLSDRDLTLPSLNV